MEVNEHSLIAYAVFVLKTTVSVDVVNVIVTNRYLF